MNGKQPAASRGRFSEPLFIRRLGIRIGLGMIVVALAALALALGKGHTIVLDDMRPKDGSYAAVRLVSVRLDRGEPVELVSGVRELAGTMGQKHRLSVDWMDGSPPQVEEFTIPFAQEYVIIYLGKLKAGLSPWLEPFFPFEQAPPEDEAQVPNQALDPVPLIQDPSLLGGTP